MWFLWIVIGLLVGLGGAFFYYKKKLEPLYNAAIEGQETCASKLVKVYNFLDSAHNAAWGPVGIREETKDELWNKLWEWADLPQNGMPRG
jgi:hypothetical protein